MELRMYLLVVVATFGFLSGLLAFVAEGKKIVDANLVRVTDNICTHPRSPAMVIGMLAGLSILVCQIMSNALAGCICCEPMALGKTKQTIRAVSFLVLSWVSFSIAFLLLIAGASINDKRGPNDNLDSSCLVLKPGVFTGAAFASFITAALGIAYNIDAAKLRQTRQIAYARNVSHAHVEGGGGTGFPIGQPVDSQDQRFPASGSRASDNSRNSTMKFVVDPESSMDPSINRRLSMQKNSFNEDLERDVSLVSRNNSRNSFQSVSMVTNPISMVTNPFPMVTNPISMVTNPIATMNNGN